MGRGTLTNATKREGERREPCGAPAFKQKLFEEHLSVTILIEPLPKKLDMCRARMLSTPYASALCHTLSNA